MYSRLWMAAVLAAGVSLLPSARAEQGPGEVVEPAEHPEPPVTSAAPVGAIPTITPRENSQPIVKMPLQIDEEGLKASVVFPEKRKPNYDQNTRPAEVKKPSRLSVPKEEGVSEETAAPAPASALEAEDPLSPLLAHALEKSREKKPQEVIVILRAAVEGEPENAEAHYRLAVAYAKVNDLKNALASMEQALLKKAAHPKYLCDYGILALRAGWTEKAVAACEAASTAVPANPRYQSALGDALLTAGQYGPASDAYLRAVHLDPNNPTYVHSLGMAHLHARSYKNAFSIFSEAIKLAPDKPQFYCSRGLASQALNQTKLAIEDYKRAIALDKKNAHAHYLLGGAYSNPDDPTHTSPIDAVMHAEEAVKITGRKNAQYIMGLARAMRVARRYDIAVDLAKSAILIDPRPEYRQELAKFEQLKNEGYTP